MGRAHDAQWIVKALTAFCMTLLGGIVFAVLDALDGYALRGGRVFHGSLNAASSVFDLSGVGSGWKWVNHLSRLVRAIVVVLVSNASRKSTKPPLN